MGRLNQCQGISLVEWKRFLSNEVGTQNTRVWTICRGKGMLKRITNAIACYRHTLEEKEISTSEIEYLRIERHFSFVGSLGGSRKKMEKKIKDKTYRCRELFNWH